MPLKNGRYTPAETAIVIEMAESGSVAAAAQRAGVSVRSVQRSMANPALLADVARRHNELLFNDILPLAVKAHRRILADPRSPPGAVVAAIKLAYDRTLGVQESVAPKEAHEYTPDELAEAIAALERVASDRARLVDSSAELGIFG